MPFKKTLVVLALISLAATIIFSIFFKENSSNNVISPQGIQPSFKEKIVKTLTPRSKLAKLIEEELEGKTGIYAVAVKNLKTKESFFMNENHLFTAASLYKLWVMAQAYEEINNGTLREADNVSLTRGEIEEIQGYWQEGVSEDAYYSVSDAIEQMIIVSDNDSAITLYSHIGTDKISEFLNRYGFSNSTFVSPPQTTAKDIFDFYEKLYQGQIVNRNYSIKMLEVLTRQRLNDRIPKYLPQDIKVAHKTGELDTFKHDAGIVNAQDSDYVLVVLTDTPNPQEAAQNIALLSQKIYDYFSN